MASLYLRFCSSDRQCVLFRSQNIFHLRRGVSKLRLSKHRERASQRYGEMLRWRTVRVDELICIRRRQISVCCLRCSPIFAVRQHLWHRANTLQKKQEMYDRQILSKGVSQQIICPVFGVHRPRNVDSLRGKLWGNWVLTNAFKKYWKSWKNSLFSIPPLFTTSFLKTCPL